MNPFDILARNLPRQIDQQPSRDPSVAVEGALGATGPADTESFDTLLKGLAEHVSGDGGDAQWQGEPNTSETATEGNASGPAGIANAVFVLLQGILPNAASPASMASSSSDEQKGGSSPLLLDGMQLSPEEGGLPNLTTAPRTAITVQHQETHFKPLVERLETGHIAEPQGETSASFDDISDDGARNELPVSLPLKRQDIQQDTRPQAGLPAAPLDAVERESGDAMNTAAKGKPMAGHSEERVEHQADPSPDSVQHDESINLPSDNLHRIARAVKSEVQSFANSSQAHPTQFDGTFRTISVKASDSALRVLNLQLHPAHLGAVTVKMRLAGESLDMELHVESEETAQLLKADSEKLSSLLRGSGYRPDTISIHVNDDVVQDRMATSKTQSDMQMQGQSFQQGSASQDGHSRNRERQNAGTSAEHHKHADEQAIPGSRSTGGVYL
ncbi:flagellar hook-length control protein FliK [Microvirga sp. ACRRW]|uniref:flagellar hook-length control protein FliK n=1 Tax=Microvirga sp. ACRRW TaxID=2918205 RepID=UPI001EF502C2|nr:flagellar hook-length control protein FliK [Microvirga sp. ACRRW]MCG7392041.1 flagellar hook-length control protein FliK [Microvirga sp. ACRRW]